MPAHSASGKVGFPGRAGISFCPAPSEFTSRKSQFVPHRYESFPAAAEGDPPGPSISPPRSPLTLPGLCRARERTAAGRGARVTGTRRCRLPSQGLPSQRGCFKGGSGVDGARLAPTTWLHVQSSESLLNMCQEVFPLKQTESWRSRSLGLARLVSHSHGPQVNLLPRLALVAKVSSLD